MESKPASHGKKTVARQKTKEHQPWVTHIYISSGPTFDAAKYRGHSVVAVVIFRNDYFSMSRVVTDPVAVG